MARYEWCAKADRFLVLDEKTGEWEKARKTKAKPVTGGLTVFSDIEEFVLHANTWTNMANMRRPLRPSVSGRVLGLSIEDLLCELVEKHGAARKPAFGLRAQRRVVEVELSYLLEPGPELLQVLVVLFEFGIGELRRPKAENRSQPDSRSARQERRLCTRSAP